MKFLKNFYLHTCTGLIAFLRDNFFGLKFRLRLPMKWHICWKNLLEITRCVRTHAFYVVILKVAEGGRLGQNVFYKKCQKSLIHHLLLYATFLKNHYLGYFFWNFKKNHYLNFLPQVGFSIKSISRSHPNLVSREQNL